MKILRPLSLKYLNPFKDASRPYLGGDVDLLEFGGEEDHIPPSGTTHFLIKAHPRLQLSNLVNNLKTVTSRLLRKEFSEHLSKFYWKPVLWIYTLGYSSLLYPFYWWGHYRDDQKIYRVTKS